MSYTSTTEQNRIDRRTRQREYVASLPDLVVDGRTLAEVGDRSLIGRAVVEDALRDLFDEFYEREGVTEAMEWLTKRETNRATSAVISALSGSTTGGTDPYGFINHLPDVPRRPPHDMTGTRGLVSDLVVLAAMADEVAGDGYRSRHALSMLSKS